MKFTHYLVKNQKIIQHFLESDNDIIKKTFMKFLDECSYFDEVQIYKVPADVCICEYSQIVEYGNNVTCEYLDDNSKIM